MTATTPCNGNMTCYAHWSKVKVYSAKIRSVKPGKGSIRIKIKKVQAIPGISDTRSLIPPRKR